MKQSKKITYCALLIAIGIALPQGLHLIGGSTAGSIFLPIQLPIFVSGIIIGLPSAATISVILPILSFLLTGMPSVIKLPFMIIELLFYSIFLNVFNIKGLPTIIRVIFTQIAGRLTLLIVYIMFNKIGVSGALTATLAIDTFIIALPGIIIQLMLIPIFLRIKRSA